MISIVVSVVAIVGLICLILYTLGLENPRRYYEDYRPKDEVDTRTEE